MVESSLNTSLKQLHAKKTEDGQIVPWRGYPLLQVMDVLNKISLNNTLTNSEWQWYYNSRCKYFNLSIDSRDGGFVTITDRDGKLMSLKDLEFQRPK